MSLPCSCFYFQAVGSFAQIDQLVCVVSWGQINCLKQHSAREISVGNHCQAKCFWETAQFLQITLWKILQDCWRMKFLGMSHGYLQRLVGQRS